MKLFSDDLHASLADPVLDSMNFLNEVTFRYPRAISFAPGRPYDGFFDNADIITYLRDYLDHLARIGRSSAGVRSHLYQYGPTAGQIRELIAHSLRKEENIDVAPEAIVVTVGAQEAMLLTLRALIAGPQDVLLISSPCYVGILGAARLLDVSVTTVPEGDGHICLADLERTIEAERAKGRRPKAFYLVPDHANPTGGTMREPERVALLELAARHEILVLEDNPYRLVSPGTRIPTLKSLDRNQTVIYLGSYSKTVFPGARVGFVIADQQVVSAPGKSGSLADELAKIKSMVTVNTSSLSQAVVGGALLACDGLVSALNARTASYYQQNLTATLANLDRQLPAERRRALGVSWNHPDGGFFLSLEVSFLADNDALDRSARDFGVLWTPMSYFYPDGGGERGIRLSVSYLTAEEIDTGIARLARFIESATGSL